MTAGSMHPGPKAAIKANDRHETRPKPTFRTATTTTTHDDQSHDSDDNNHNNPSPADGLLHPSSAHRRPKPRHRRSQSMVLPKSRSAVQLSAPHRGLTVDEFYPDPETAQRALAMERESNRRHVRSATPHVPSRRPLSTISTHTHVSEASDNTIVPDPATIGPDEPHFGSARGIGPPIEAAKVYGLGRKEPRHRKYSANLLKPALRTASSRESEQPIRNKPLPRRPSSFIVPFAFGPSAPSFARVSQRELAKDASGSSGLRSLFSALSITPHGEGSFETPFSRNGASRHRHLSIPPDDLFSYLRNIEIPVWTSWPGQRDDRRSSTASLRLLQKQRGFEAMPPAWHARLAAAESGRQVGRALTSWESNTRNWLSSTLDWLDNNVPSEKIDPENRWGEQIFALHANGFDSLEFHDEDADESDDLGLLAFVNGAILQTAVSVLHMLRYSSQSFSFSFLPNSTCSPHGSQTAAPTMWDGIGTFVLMNNAKESERSMIVEVRPPHIVDSATLREFSKSWRHEQWWHLPAQYCVGDSGQANLLQAQVYDSCVQNQVYFFVVTNTKQWVFGAFDSKFRRCTVSPVIDRKQRDPSVMQCLVAWTVRSVDERPRQMDTHRPEPQPDDLLNSLNRNRRAGEIFIFDESPRSPPHRSLSRQANHGDDTPLPGLFPQPPFSLSQTSFHGPVPYAMPSSPPPMGGEFGAYPLPGYYDLHPGSPHGFSPVNGYHTWAGGYPSPPPGGTGNNNQYGSSWYSGFVWPGVR